MVMLPDCDSSPPAAWEVPDGMQVRHLRGQSGPGALIGGHSGDLRWHSWQSAVAAYSQRALPLTFDPCWWSNYLAYVIWVCYRSLGTTATNAAALSLTEPLFGGNTFTSGLLAVITLYCLHDDRLVLQACTVKWHWKVYNGMILTQTINIILCLADAG